MKNNYLYFMALIGLFSISACSQEDAYEVEDDFATTVTLTYLDIGKDLDKIEISNLTLAEEKIYNEAKERFSSIVGYKNQQFYLIHNDYQQLYISESLYKHFKKIMNRSNNEIRELTEEQVGDVSVYSDMASHVKLKTRREGDEGKNGFERTWYGFDVYLSRSSLVAIAAGSGVVSTIARYVPDATLSKAVSAACGISATVAGYKAATSPRGIVIYFTFPVLGYPGACVPFYIENQ